MLSFAGVLLGCLMNKMLEDAWQRQFVWKLAKSEIYCMAVPVLIYRGINYKILPKRDFNYSIQCIWRIFLPSRPQQLQRFVIDVGLRNFLWVYLNGYFGTIDQKTIRLTDVELFKKLLVITTNSGLWRYLIAGTPCVSPH
jgi:hypothetical protein